MCYYLTKNKYNLIKAVCVSNSGSSQAIIRYKGIVFPPFSIHLFIVNFGTFFCLALLHTILL